MTTTTTTTIYRDDEVIGWITELGCENPNCIAQIGHGLPFHATATGFAVCLEQNHYATIAEARAAIEAAMADRHGRNVNLDVGDDHAWRDEVAR